MKKLLIAVAVIVAVVVAAAVALPFLVPVEQYRSRIEAAVSQRTGRDFRIEGPMKLSLLPTLALELNQAVLASPPGASSADMVRLGRLDIRLDPWPLLRGEIEVDRLVLVEPAIALEVNAQGVPNWRFGSGSGAAAPAPPEETAGRGLPELRFGQVELVDGTVRYFDARTGADYAATDVDVRLDLPGLDQPAALDGHLLFRDRPVTVRATTARPRALLENGTAPLTLTVNSDPATLSFDGTVDAGAARAQGVLSAKAGAVPDLVAWLTGKPAGDLPVQKAELGGTLDATATRVALAGARYTVGDVEGRGDLTVALSGPRPKLTGTLDVGRVNVDRFLAGNGTASAPAQEPTPAPVATVPAPAEASGWSTAPIDFSALHTADADLKASVAGLTVRGVDVGAADLAVMLNDGRLDATLGETALFDGTVSGQVTADAAAAVPALGLDLRINGVQAEPVLTRFARMDRLSGATKAAARLRTAGNNQLALVEGLNGQGSATFLNGALKGINLAALVRNAIATVQGRPLEENVPQQTDFAELGGTFTVENGVVRSDDLRLLAPLLRVAGRGNVALPPRTVDMRLEPRLVGTIEGQGGNQDVSGLTVPVLVRGSFENVTFTPDLAGLAEQALRDPKAVREQVEGLLEGKKPADAARGLVEGLMGGQPQQQQQQQPAGEGQAAPANPIQQQLKGLFGR
jgi:AsmA protein